MITLSNYIII